ncbi:solute carrier family 2, facilitated glucose transporter member 8-like [Ostrinia furnacalis]|uniref:solute carrier family 2, facilitated glucose transporter member 8-like n=1 Tax=Ostrinia furnacalis TaxID=93504 RepID=UPI00103E4E95|nr:solute carrier family 2, facilitated glucose transporter member 8-like [Ostrinia furnacalis]
MAKLTSDIKERPQPRFHALKTLCLSPASRRGFIILLMAFTMEVLMGLAPVQVYAKQVFIEADPYHGDLYSVILAVCWCLGSVLCSALTDRFGRRVLLITSASSSGVCLVILGALLQTQLAPPWVTVLFIMVFCFCFLCASGTVPYVLMCELFSPEVQTLASMLIVQWLFISAFIILALFNWLSRLVGIHYIFYGFAVNSCIYVLFSYFVIPETKGLSNKQIQQALLEGR